MIALRELEFRKIRGGNDDLIIFNVIETSVGFVYEWGNENYLKTEDPNYLLIGARPFLVDGEDGTVYYFRPKSSLEEFITDYKDKKAKGEL